MDKKKCWCYVTYAFLTDEIPPIPIGPKEEQVQVQEQLPMPEGFEPNWFLRAKFPEDED